MARILLMLVVMISFFIILFTVHSEMIIIGEEEEQEEYVLDNPLPHFRSTSRFLEATTYSIKKGSSCDLYRRDICNGVSANKGTSLLYCCKMHCRNVLGDNNNCGRCSKKCRFGESCCMGTCTKVMQNANHCGECNEKCPAWIRCEYGICGYA